MVTIISRKQLYARVWRQPITHIANEFGISDVGLRKACKRHRIPTPPAGHWAKAAYGKELTVINLPDPDDDHAIRIWHGASGREPEAVARARAHALAAVPDALTVSEHPAIERTLAKLRNAKPGRDELVRSTGAKLLAVAVRPELLTRVEQLLRALAAAGEAAGLELRADADAIAWHCDGETVAFELVEAADHVEHVATENELAAHAKWQREREETHKRYGYWSNYGEPKIPKWEEQYNGRLAIRLEKVRIKSEQDPWGQPIRGTFADSRTRDVIRMIPSIVAAIAAIAAAKVNNAAYDERRKAAEEEARRRRQEEERRRYEWQRAGKLIEDLIETQREAARLGEWLAGVLSAGSLPPRTLRLIEVAERRLTKLRQDLSVEALETKLETAHLFEPIESVPR